MTEASENTPSSSSEADFKTWAGLVYPLEFLPDEQISFQRYWKESWPTKAPDSRLTWRPNRYRSVSELWEAMASDHAGYNFAVTFATVNAQSGQRIKSAFCRSQAIGLDLDCGEDKEFASVGAIKASLEEFRGVTGLRPGACVFTGSGVQAYFLLTEPTADGDRLERVLRRLIAALGADTGASDRLRILRPPGGWNFKYKPPRLVTLADACGVRYSLDEIESKLPELGESDPDERGTPTADFPDNGRPITKVPKSIAPYLAGGLPSGFKGDLSRRDFLVARKLLEAGHSPADVLATMRQSKLGTQAIQRKADGEDYLRRTVAAAARGRSKPKTTTRKPARARSASVAPGSARRAI